MKQSIPSLIPRPPKSVEGGSGYEIIIYLKKWQLLSMGLLSLCYRELPKFGKCNREYRHCAVRLKTFGAST